jgi:transcriptional regulator GlxA family with amidase domain
MSRSATSTPPASSKGASPGASAGSPAGASVAPSGGPGRPRSVLVVLFDGVELLDAAGPAEVFDQASAFTRAPAYSVRYVAASASGQVRTSAGLTLAVEPLPRVPPKADLLLVPGAAAAFIDAALANAPLLDWLRRAWPRARRHASVCSGALLVGAIGGLDGRRVTTHWQVLADLAARHPRAHVERDALFVQDGDLWSSAGILSGVDMALAIVRADLGSGVALAVARNLVVYVVRAGGQSQFSGSVNFQSRAAQGDLQNLVAWLQANVEQDIGVEAMAEHCAMSVRNLHRRCRMSFGLAPAALFAELRLEHARSLLLDATMSVARAAHACGFATPAAFSKAFRRRFGVSPQQYRASFRGDDGT